MAEAGDPDPENNYDESDYAAIEREVESEFSMPRKTSMLYTAIEWNDTVRVRKLLSETGDGSVDVNKYVDTGETPLLVAVIARRAPIVKLLLEHGADVNKASKNTRFTPLFASVASGDVDMVKLLLEYGADINAKLMDGKNVLHTASNYDYRATGKMAEFLLTVRPELAREPDNNGLRPNLSAVDMTRLRAAIATDAKSRRMAATAPIAHALAARAAAKGKYDAKEESLQRGIDEIWKPKGGPGGGTRRRRRKTGKASKARKALKKKTAKRRR